jgi:hypothetical protein
MLVVVGGHSRNIGKTSVAAGIIRATRHARWTAVKITQHGHGICSAAGEPCGCAIEYEHPYALSEEREPSSSDSGRFLAAGAERAYWLRTPVGQLGNAMPELRRILAQAHNTILESNSVLGFLQPDLYLVVLDFANPDMKDSTRTFLNRAHALVLLHDDLDQPWNVPARWLEEKPRFVVTPPDYVTEKLVKFVSGRILKLEQSRE